MCTWTDIYMCIECVCVCVCVCVFVIYAFCEKLLLATADPNNLLNKRDLFWKALKTDMKHENIKHETQCYLHGVSSNPESYRKREASQIPGNSNFVSSVSWKLVYGICETKFKLRHANHKKSFNHRNCRSDTELSNKFWKIKDNKTQRKHNMGDFR